MVSVIVPVYNVEKYIDQCLESVVNQTYTDIEILVMEAKSTDKSLDRVLAWAKNDDRFTVVSRRDGGLGPARNYALQIARGEFIVFLDADDWMERDYIEKTLQVFRSDPEIDIVMTGFYMHTADAVKTCMESMADSIYGDVNNKKRIMVYGNNSMWGKVFRREVFLSHRITQPALPYEDLAVYPALVAAARKISVCSSAFIHYRMARPGSLMGNVPDAKKVTELIDYGMSTLKQIPGWEEYVTAFYACIHRKLLHLSETIDWTRMAVNDCCAKEFSICEAVEKYRYVVYGGFSSRWAIHRMAKGKQRLSEHMAFTCLISQMSEGKSGLGLAVKNENAFRQQCLKWDICKRLQDAISNISKEDGPDTIYVFDFLNECQDILQVDDNSYITLSEALRDVEPDVEKEYVVVPWQSEKYWELWKTCCDRLILLLRNHICTNRIALFRYYFAEYFKENGKLSRYGQIDEIRKKNLLLEQMYTYFGERMPEIKQYELPKDLAYTDVEGQGMVASPEYQNHYAYHFFCQTLESNLMEEQHG